MIQYNQWIYPNTNFKIEHEHSGSSITFDAYPRDIAEALCSASDESIDSMHFDSEEDFDALVLRLEQITKILKQIN